MMNKPTISKRGKGFPVSALRGNIIKFDEQQASGRICGYFPGHIGQPRKLMSHPLITANCGGNPSYWEYAPSQGRSDLLGAIETYLNKVFGLKIQRQNIQVWRGASAAIRELVFALCDHEDEIMVPVPGYTAYFAILYKIGVNIIPVPLKYNEDFSLPSDEILEKYLTPKTKVFLLTFPNNPVGNTYNKEALERIGRFCKKHNLWLVADAAYAALNRFRHCSLLNLDFDERVVEVYSTSKDLNSCGLRVGFSVTRREDLQNVLLRQAQAELAEASLSQSIAAQALNEPHPFVDELAAEYTKRTNVAYEIFLAAKMKVYKPEGPFYLFPRVEGLDSDLLIKHLIHDFKYSPKEFPQQDWSVVISPGEAFFLGLKGDPKIKEFFRLACTLPAEIMADGACAIVRAVRELQNQ